MELDPDMVIDPKKFISPKLLPTALQVVVLQ